MNIRNIGRSGSVWREIAVSWMSLKTWVKVWLFFLNAVFLGVLVFLPEPLVGWTMLAYVLAGVLLLGIMVPQRGLSRLLGLGHLIPWAPLLVYLVLRLSSDVAGSRIAPAADPGLFAYVLLLAGVVSVCLAFDLYDVLRWVGGERHVTGSAEAVEAGALRRARPRRSRRVSGGPGGLENDGVDQPGDDPPHRLPGTF